MPTKTATKKAPANKKPVKKTATKKAATKKKVVSKKVTPIKKKSATKKKATSNKRKNVVRATKTVTDKKVTPNAVSKKASEKTKKLLNKLVELPTETNLPPVEEKSPTVNTPAIVAPDRDNKLLQRAAVRNYVKHQIRLSNKKGGLKPSGKKPLW